MYASFQNILEVCDGPAEVARLLERFAKEIQSGSAKSGQGQTEGSPSLETLFLSTARTANNFAMDIKSQSQLEVCNKYTVFIVYDSHRFFLKGFK